MSSWCECGDLSAAPAHLFATANESIVAYQPQDNRWFCFSLAGIDWTKQPPNWADCIFSDTAAQLISKGVQPIMLLNLDCLPGKGSGPALLLDFLRYLRLSKYHPKALSFPEYELWRSPVACFSFQTRESIVRRKPEGLVLFAPSVYYRQLPLQLDQFDRARLISIEAASDAELVRFVNSTHPVNLSSNHSLGDIVGPYSLLKTIGMTTQVSQFDSYQRLLAQPKVQTIKTATLHEMLWQEKQRKDSMEDVNPAADVVAKSVNSIRSLSERKPILIVDDQDSLWGGVWEELFGKAGMGWESRSSLSTQEVASAQDFRAYQFVILDLRLNDQEGERQLEDISGYQALQSIRKNDAAVPILMFTSSRRGSFLQGLRRAGADAVCLKPVRFDSAPALLEKLLDEIQLLLSPEFELLRSIYYELIDKERLFTASEGLPSSFRWARAAWAQARQNVRSWLTQKNTEQVRLSGVAVARTAGLAAEAIKDAFKRTLPNNHSYYEALWCLRNDASHIGPEQALGVEVGLIAVTLANKLISTLNSKNTRLFNPNIPLESARVSERTLEAAIPLNTIPYDMRKDIRGSIQVAILAHELGAKQKKLGLSAIAPYLAKLESNASQVLERLCKDSNTAKAELQPFINTYPSFQLWFDTLKI